MEGRGTHPLPALLLLWRRKTQTACSCQSLRRCMEGDLPLGAVNMCWGRIPSPRENAVSSPPDIGSSEEAAWSSSSARLQSRPFCCPDCAVATGYGEERGGRASLLRSPSSPACLRGPKTEKRGMGCGAEGDAPAKVISGFG